MSHWRWRYSYPVEVETVEIGDARQRALRAEEEFKASTVVITAGGRGSRYRTTAAENVADFAERVRNTKRKK